MTDLTVWTVHGLILVVALLAAVWLLLKIRYWFGFDVSELPRIAQGIAKKKANDTGRIYLLAFVFDLLIVAIMAGILSGVFPPLYG